MCATHFRHVKCKTVKRINTIIKKLCPTHARARHDRVVGVRATRSRIPRVINNGWARPPTRFVRVRYCRVVFAWTRPDTATTITIIILLKHNTRTPFYVFYVQGAPGQCRNIDTFRFCRRHEPARRPTRRERSGTIRTKPEIPVRSQNVKIVANKTVFRPCQ